MSTAAKLKGALEALKNGNVNKKNIAYLRNFSMDETKWLSGLDRDEIMKISQQLRSFLISTEIDDESSCHEEALQEVSLLVLSTLTTKDAAINTMSLTCCLRPICFYLEKKLEKANDSKIKNKPGVLKMLTLLKKCFKLGGVNYQMCSERLVICCINIVLLAGPHKDLKRKCILFLSAVSAKETANMTCTLLGCIEKILSEKSTKKMGVYEKRFSAATYLIVCMVQHNLADQSADQEITFRKSFGFAAQLVEELSKNCEKNTKENKICVIFIEKFIDDLIAMDRELLWPAAVLLLSMMTKKMCCYLIQDFGNKVKAFAVKQLGKIALSNKSKELDSGDSSKKLAREFRENFIPGMMFLVTKYLEDLKLDSVYGNVCSAYVTLWSNYLPKHEVDTKITRKTVSKVDALSALYHLECSSRTHAGFQFYLRYILFAVGKKCKIVKTAAVKSLGNLIHVEPNILAYANVEKALADCLPSLSATGREALIEVLMRYLEAHPEGIDRYASYIRDFLDDSSPSVQRSAVKAVTVFFKFSERSDLALKVLSLINSPHESVQKAVVEFFSSVWLKENKYVNCLLNIAYHPAAVSWITTLLTTQKIATRIICQSQAQVPEPQMTLSCYERQDEEFEILVATVILRLQGEPHTERRLTAALLLLAIAQVHPHLLMNHVAILQDICFHASTEEYSLRRTICEILVLVTPFLCPDARQDIATMVRDTLKNEASVELPIVVMTTLLKLLLAVSGGFDGNLRLEYVAPSLEILKTHEGTAEEANNDVRKALYFVIYLWKDYARDTEAAKLVLNYLKSPTYNQTVLGVMCQVRLEFIPSSQDLYLLKLLSHFLELKTDQKLVITALYFVTCTMQGYRKTYQKPEMKALGDTTTEAVSHLLQCLLPQVLDCSLDAATEVRKRAGQAIYLIAESGLILMPRLIPHLIAMTTDPDAAVRKKAQILLGNVSESWDLSLSAKEGLRLAFMLAKTLNSQRPVRGFVTEISTCALSYQLVQSNSGKARKFIDNIFNVVENEPDYHFALYLIDQIVYFPYKIAGEVIHVMQSFVKTITSFSNKNVILELLKLGETSLLHQYPTVAKKMVEASGEKWSKESVSRSKNARDYVPSTFLHSLGSSSVSIEEFDGNSDPEMEISLAELRRRSMSKQNNCNDILANAPLPQEGIVNPENGEMQEQNKFSVVTEREKKKTDSSSVKRSAEKPKIKKKAPIGSLKKKKESLKNMNLRMKRRAAKIPLKIIRSVLKTKNSGASKPILTLLKERKRFVIPKSPSISLTPEVNVPSKIEGVRQKRVSFQIDSTDNSYEAYKGQAMPLLEVQETTTGANEMSPKENLLTGNGAEAAANMASINIHDNEKLPMATDCANVIDNETDNEMVLESSENLVEDAHEENQESIEQNVLDQDENCLGQGRSKDAPIIKCGNRPLLYDPASEEDGLDKNINLGNNFANKPSCVPSVDNYLTDEENELSPLNVSNIKLERHSSSEESTDLVDTDQYLWDSYDPFAVGSAAVGNQKVLTGDENYENAENETDEHEHLRFVKLEKRSSEEAFDEELEALNHEEVTDENVLITNDPFGIGSGSNDGGNKRIKLERNSNDENEENEENGPNMNPRGVRLEEINPDSALKDPFGIVIAKNGEGTKRITLEWNKSDESLHNLSDKDIPSPKSVPQTGEEAPSQEMCPSLFGDPILSQDPFRIRKVRLGPKKPRSYVDNPSQDSLLNCLVSQVQMEDLANNKKDWELEEEDLDPPNVSRQSAENGKNESFMDISGVWERSPFEPRKNRSHDQTTPLSKRGAFDAASFMASRKNEKTLLPISPIHPPESPIISSGTSRSCDDDFIMSSGKQGRLNVSLMQKNQVGDEVNENFKSAAFFGPKKGLNNSQDNNTFKSMIEMQKKRKQELFSQREALFGTPILSEKNNLKNEAMRQKNEGDVPPNEKKMKFKLNLKR